MTIPWSWSIITITMVSLRSKITQKLLNYFFVNPKASQYINELAKILHVDPKNLYRKLMELEREGLFESEFKGKQRYYRLSANFPLLKQYKEIFMKTYGIENIFRSAFTCIPGMKEAYVYGSYARGEMDPHSDIDVLAIGDHSVIETGRKVAKLQKELGREINVVNMSVSEYEGRIKKKDAFIMDVKKNRKIRLI